MERPGEDLGGRGAVSASSTVGQADARLPQELNEVAVQAASNALKEVLPQGNVVEPSEGKEGSEVLVRDVVDLALAVQRKVRRSKPSLIRQGQP